MAYIGTIKQNVVADAVNSSTANLAGGGTFTGTASSTLGVALIQVSLKTDQNCTVNVLQSPDAANWDLTDTYTYYYAKGGQSWDVRAEDSYFKVTVTNLNAATATTYFRLQSALCPIGDPVPRALSEDGCLKVDVGEISSNGFDKASLVSPMRALKTVESTRLVGAVFVGSTLDPNFWASSTGTGGTVSQALGEVTFATGATANNAVSLQSMRAARYVSANTNTFRAVWNWPAVTTSSASYKNERRVGAYNATDGYYFGAIQLNPATTPYLTVNCLRNGSLLSASNGAFNGDLGNTYDLNASVHTYEIYWTNSSAWFFIDDNFIHKFTGTANSLSGTQTLPVRVENINSGGNTANNTMTLRVASISRLGKLETESQYKHLTGAATTVCKYGAGRLHKIIINQNGTLATVYDQTSAVVGTEIAAIDTTKATGNTGTIIFDCPFSTGLTIVTTGAGTDLTVVYE